MALQSTTAIASVTLQGTAPSVIFSAIPTGYRDLILMVDGLLASGSENLLLRFNSDSNSNYANIYMFGSGTGTGAAPVTTTGILGGGINTSNKTLQTFQILDYRVTNKHKSTLNRTDTNNDATYAWAGRWANTDPINSIEIRPSSSGTLASGMTVSLYGRIA